MTRTRVPIVLAAAAILCQIGYPLTSAGDFRNRLTVLTVCLFCAAGVSDAWVRRGAQWAATYLLVTVTVGFAAEAVGVHTGFPFGSYDYADSLGPKLAGVPLVIPLAWAMFAYPALLVGRRIGATSAETVGAAALALASWDVFLDPQMVDAGHWTWASPTPSLPGVTGIPLTNFAGWLAVALVLMAALNRVLPRDEVSEVVPATLFFWTWVGSTLAAAAFFDRPSVALVGGILMALTAVPYARRILEDHR